jgi:hypothetical protein
MHFRLGLILLAALCCGGSEEPAQISVAGTYATAVTLTENTCGTVDVQPNTTTIVQTPGSLTFTLTHAGNSYNGQLSMDGNFNTLSRTLTSGGSSFTIAIAGRFSQTGFEAAVEVLVSQTTAPTNCRYVVRWVGTRNSGTNTLP